MASVSSNAVTTFNEWKLGRTPGNYLIFKLNNSTIDLVKIGPTECSWENFCKELKIEESCWAVVHFDYNTKDGAKRNKTLFVQWIPSHSPVREKMQYAMWTTNLKRSLSGIHTHLQAGNVDDLDLQNVMERVTKFEREQV